MWTYLIPFIIFGYFVVTYILMQFTFKFSYTLNWFIFRKELLLPQKSIIHYVEITMIILLVIGLITTLISLVQILINERKING